jgi:hypothetical protein
MTGVFERLQKQLDAQRQEGGISVLDLAGLPPVLRKIMRLMLRQVRMKYIELVEAIEQLPENERMTTDDLDKALQNLTEQAWLIQIGAGKQAVYKVNLRRKAGSHLPETIWQNLDSKLKK